MDEWTWELLAGPETITEGPAWDGSGLFYTSIEASEIRRFDPATAAIGVVHRDTAATNGLIFAPDGSLYGCEGGGRAIVRYDASGAKTTLVGEFEGERLNSPNDLVMDRRGRIWFTDPRYGDQADKSLSHDSVYRITPTRDGSVPWQIERLTFDTVRPNGLLLSFGERTLYVAESDFLPGSTRQLRAYPIRRDGSLGPPQVLHDFGDARGIDGMCWDLDGDIVATCGWELSGPGSRITIFSPDGDVLKEHPLPAGRPTNCVFGGADLSHLYVTTIECHLYRVADTGRVGGLQAPDVPPFIG
ncbi:MAG: SMP-30/gluconolactonase/LRE family protein [Thermomicrobiales bacterium]